MKIIVTSKANFPKMVQKTKESSESWAYISIECTDDLVEIGTVEDNNHFLKSGPDVLNLDFDDVSETRSNIIFKGKTYKASTITKEQARAIVEFVERHFGYNLLIHCMAGQSRSQGVARALWDLYPDVWQEVEENKQNPCTTPNITVVAEIKRVIYERYYK